MDNEPLQSQVDRLARFIMDEVPGEPSQSEGAIDTAIRIMREQKQYVDLLEKIVNRIREEVELV